MSVDTNKNNSRRLIEEAFNKGNLGVVREICSPDCVLHDPSAPGGELRGPDSLGQFVTVYRTAFPDLVCTVEDQVAQGDRVVTRWSAQGTHRGDFMGIAPTGKKMHITGITLDRYSNGKLSEAWNNFDSLGLLQQLGVVPAMAQTQTPARARG